MFDGNDLDEALPDNPVTVDPMTIRDVEVLETIKEGQTVYRAR